MEYLVHVDSKNRDANIYPFGNTYVLNLVTPLKRVSRVELVIARLPNTMYNLTVPQFLTYSNISGTYPLTLPAGFYSASCLARDLNAANNVPSLTVSYLSNEGKFLFASRDPSFTIGPLTSEGVRLSGLQANVTATLDTTWPQYANNMSLNGYYLAKSSNVVDMGTNEFVFLDIEELRTNTTHDARKYVQIAVQQPSGNTIYQTTTDGSLVERTFGIISLDVDAGMYKVHKESADYKLVAEFPQRIASLAKLTIRWHDSQGRLLNFNGIDHNSMVLRFTCDPVPVTLERPEGLPPPVQMERRRRFLLIGIALFLSLGLILISFMRKDR